VKIQLIAPLTPVLLRTSPNISKHELSASHGQSLIMSHVRSKRFCVGSISYRIITDANAIPSCDYSVTTLFPRVAFCCRWVRDLSKHTRPAKVYQDCASSSIDISHIRVRKRIAVDRSTNYSDYQVVNDRHCGRNCYLSQMKFEAFSYLYCGMPFLRNTPKFAV
jgi:hypothetical protein